jgi:hypothetical protein
MTAHRGPYDNFPRLAIFPVRDANFGQIERQSRHTSLAVFISILDCSVKKHLGYLQTLLLLRDIFLLDDFVEIAKNKRIRPAASD